MKYIIKLSVLIVFIFNSFQGGAQINYKISKSTNKISDLDYVFHFKKKATYDVDFKEFSNEKYSTLKVAVKLDSNGKGKLTLGYDHPEKVYSTVESVVEKTYTNSSSKYWEISGRYEDGIPYTLYLGFKDNLIYNFWYEFVDNTRIYHHVN
ncbi:hypothetical protein [uncultured Lutibacter sp.]|uniref:hypothetical protein n=1 Tax=uncultured Lutibacter sp. TaxID=437739 RepID=UPI0026241F68|nr:hypothetical protein [uncultured Lutibacter sp.]